MMTATTNPAATNEVLEWTSPEALQHLDRGDLTAERYASLLLQRYHDTRGLNAVTWIDEGRVLESARAFDEARTRGQKKGGRLAGLPILVKDNINTVGFPTTAGVAALRNYYPEHNARLVDILFGQDAILLGKANMDELSRGFTNSNATYGFAKNPYDLTRVPGGGAGGLAVACAARIATMGMGSDTAGSARVPACWSGIAAMRPSSSGRIRGYAVASWTATSLEDGIFPIAWSATIPSPMGRTVADVALLDAVVAGTAVPSPISLRGARLGVPRGFYWEDLQHEVERLGEAALDRLRDRGAQLIEVDLRAWAKTALPTFFVVATMHGFQDLTDFLTRYKTGVTAQQIVDSLRSKEILARSHAIMANPVTPAQADQAMRTRLRLALEYEELFRRHNLAALVYPTIPITAPLIRPQGDDITDTIELNGRQVVQFDTSLRNTHVSGVVGIPSVNVPIGLAANGLPVGMTFSGLADSEPRLLGLCLSAEAAFGRVPAPKVHPGHAGPPHPLPPGAPPPSGGPAPSPGAPPPVGMPPKATDDVDRVLTLLRQSAYLGLCARVDVPDPDRSSTFTVKAALRRQDVDFRLDGCGSGLHTVSLIGDEVGWANVSWTFKSDSGPRSAAAARPFTSNDVFVLDDDEHNQLRGSGSGRLVASLFSDGHVGVQAQGNIVDGTGVFAGVQGSYAIAGRADGSRLTLHITLRLMDPTGRYQTTSELLYSEGTEMGDRLVTPVALLGEPDPEHPVQLTPTGAIVHELLRAVHTDFDRADDDDGLRATITKGPIVARWRTDVTFNPADPSAPGTADRPIPVRMDNVKVTFLDASTGTLDASLPDARGYVMAFPNVSGPLLRMTGYGPIGPGTGRFRGLKGTISMLAALDLAPPAFSNFYLIHLADPDGVFRC